MARVQYTYAERYLRSSLRSSSIVQLGAMEGFQALYKYLYKYVYV